MKITIREQSSKFERVRLIQNLRITHTHVQSIAPLVTTNKIMPSIRAFICAVVAFMAVGRPSEAMHLVQGSTGVETSTFSLEVGNVAGEWSVL